MYQGGIANMNLFLKSAVTAVAIAAAVQSFTVGVVADWLPREVCRPDVRSTWEKQFNGVKSFHINNADGPVSVVTHDSPHLKVSATISAYVKTYEERARAQRYIKTLFAATQDGDTLRLKTEPKGRPGEVQLSVSYDIAVPIGVHLTIENTRGNVFLGEGCGNVTVTCSTSDIDIRGPKGVVTAETTNGRIDLVAASREATLRNVNGSLRAEFTGRTLTINTVNGSIDVRLPQTGVRHCDLTTTNGDITLLMNPACSAEVNAITRQGVVNSDFEVVPLMLGQKPTELRGFIGQAETQLTVSTFAGNIRIERSTT